MPLDDLVGVIGVLRQRIADHGPTLTVSETRTRVALIDPLLQVLGWDTADPSIVVPEYDVNNRKIDYALLGQNSIPAAIVEAKRLDSQLQPFLEQMISNARIVGVEIAGITDGDQWELYEVLRSDTSEVRQLLNLKISSSSSHLSALKLLLFWRPNLASGQIESSKMPVAAPPSMFDPVTPVSDSIDWVPLSKFVALKALNRPEFIRFPDGSERRLKAWYDLALQSIEWLWSKRLLTSDTISKFSTSHRHLFHTDAVHPSGRPFFNPKQVAGTPLFFEANLSSFEATKRAKALMFGCRQDLSRVHLGVQRK
ncbi:MAG: hypothetical protein F4Y42_05770 [Caldilineaceae bacterium SB0664_bin_27]|uniref:Type I restriction enzyme R protein N-terminal domain-containing protein n=1 Tax=Caldilineaceae bacterium SB0664_bin_27 TaxID=2605260 RepID=A0A6B0YT82_9CHLR|nr:hypothetical protein [Caldilineaceae bacterium SB0664_bin_27]